jgi:hypothetical protein
VARSAWCVEHQCRPETPFTVTKSGVVNHPFTLPPGENALVEVQTRDTVLLGAGLMLWNAGHTAGPKTQASLASFARGLVGDCAGVEQHVQAQYLVTAEAVGAAPPVDCGPWTVRAGRLPGGFFVSVDRRPPKGAGRATVLDSVARDSAGRDSARRDSAGRDSLGRDSVRRAASTRTDAPPPAGARVPATVRVS